MSTFVLLTITGFGLGAMYFLIASGLSLIYGLMGVLNFAHGAFKGSNLSNLRADVHLESTQAQVLEFGSARIDIFDFFVSDAEFVLVRSSRDVFVRARIDIRIDPQCDRCGRLFRSRNSADVFQLRFALDIETVNALFERIFDFVARFADSRERAFLRICTSLNCAEKFAA